VQLACERATSPSGMKLANWSRLAGHLLVDPLQTLHKAADVVWAVAILPDGVDDLLDGARTACRWLDREGGRIAEIRQQAASKQSKT